MKDNWIKYPLILTGENVELVSLERKHFGELEALAKDKRIWEFYVLDCSDPVTFSNSYNEALIEKENGNQFPFIILDKHNNKLIGSTRFLDIKPKDKKLEIGWTWLHPECWATSVNIECKLLLLTFCFEELQAVRVQFKSDENNIRSRKAIEKTGAKFEGIQRNDMIRYNGTKRNSAFYSIIDTEWDQVKKNLNDLFETKKK